MHITVELERFKKLLELVARVSTKHLTLASLQCVKLSVIGDVLTLEGTNLEIGVVGTMSVHTVHSEGEVAVHASTLLQIVNLVAQKEIDLKVEEGALIITSSQATTTLKTFDTADFPSIARISGGAQKINGKLFSIGIRASAFAASVSSIKPELGSIYVHQKKSQSLTFVATDSFRLMEKTVPMLQVVLEQALLIPSKNALELVHACEVFVEDPELLVNENQCALSFPSFYITSRLVSGTFPDYEQIIPKEYATETTVLTREVQQALKKTGIFLNKFMQLSLDITTKNVVFSSQSGEVGTTSEQIPASTDGASIKLSFNQRYLTDALPHFIDDSVTLRCAGIGRPMVIVGTHDLSIRYLVMPMNK